MKKKYKICLVIVGALLVLTLMIGTTYSLYVSLNKNTTKESTILDCFKIYYSNGEYVEMFNIKPVLDEEGRENSPSTLTIKNICPDEKELQLRLNVLNGTTANIDALTIEASGNIEQKPILYKKLTSTKTVESNVLKSKLIGIIKIKPDETVRTNLKMWFNEKKAPNISPDAIFIAKYELIDSAFSLKLNFAETLLNTYEEKTAPDFNNIAINDEGLYSIEDELGTSYYFRGNVKNNYVSFANNLWRIVRINGDNSIRLILQDNIDNKRYSEYIWSTEYAGMQYRYNDEMVDNNINVYIKNWYEENIQNQGLDSYVLPSSFCNDSNYTSKNYHTYFTSYDRLVTNKEPTLICAETKNRFGGTLIQKVGLLSADEAVLAGGVYGIENPSLYLNNGTTFFTSTPTEYYNYVPFVMTIRDTGALVSSSTYTMLGIRPVINLDSVVTVSGSGTINDPYTIDLD